MVFTEESKAKMYAKLLERFGSDEAIAAWRKNIGTLGGQNGKGHEFGHGKVDPATAGSKGGSISRRKKQGETQWVK